MSYQKSISSTLDSLKEAQNELSVSDLPTDLPNKAAAIRSSLELATAIIELRVEE